MLIWENCYTIVDLLQEYPIQQYSNITEFDDGTIARTNARGIIGQYFKEHNIIGKPVKYRYCPYGNEYTGQNANTMGRFVILLEMDKESVKKLTIEQIKEHIRTFHKYNPIFQREDFLLYNRTGYELLIEENKERKISKAQEKQKNTYYIEDKTKEFDLFKITATSKRQAINKYFKAHDITEKPYHLNKLTDEIGATYFQYGLYGRFNVYSEAAPKNGTLYNREGFAVLYDWRLGQKEKDNQEVIEYTVSELIKNFNEWERNRKQPPICINSVSESTEEDYNAYTTSLSEILPKEVYDELFPYLLNKDKSV